MSRGAVVLINRIWTIEYEVFMKCFVIRTGAVKKKIKKEEEKSKPIFGYQMQPSE